MKILYIIATILFTLAGYVAGRSRSYSLLKKADKAVDEMRTKLWRVESELKDLRKEYYDMLIEMAKEPDAED